MAKSRHNSNTAADLSESQIASPDEANQDEATLEPLTAEPTKLSTTAKRIVSLLIAGYLFVLILGPLSNPIGSEHLTRPLAKKVSPIYRLLFLGHGYRFFAPDPGPSHLVEYEITKQDGSKIVGRFPDRNNSEFSFPRLKYHRWFMLSETLCTEHLLTPIKSEFVAEQNRLEQVANAKQIAGQHEIAAELRAQRQKRKTDYEAAKKRNGQLFRSVAKGLLEIHGGTSIKLFVREREIPFPIEVREGAKLDDAKYLSPELPLLIGEFKLEDLKGSRDNTQPSPQPQKTTAPPKTDSDRTLDPEPISQKQGLPNFIRRGCHA
jgi:hypothetical protein